MTATNRIFMSNLSACIGHALGLHHSNNMNSIMYAFYGSSNTNYSLNSDDKTGIRILYGNETIKLP